MYRRLQRLGGRVRGRAWSSSAKPASTAGTNNAAQTGATTVGASTRSATPGTVRVTKGFGADKHEAELDSTIARIIGSDWGDRSHQPVSMAMRMYWIIFGLVLANGVFTYVAGKDESFLVEKLKKKADEKLGVEEEENEFEEMAGDQQQHEAASAARRPKTKAELEQQLAQLRLQQERLQKQIRSGEGVMKEELEHHVRMIDVQKDQVKRHIKSL
ncbi:hypothetical protein PHYSODRAFT_559905 [Phytophthora sojae]|uniref:Uncharacterized protein n=1 Tax=Phytophthora sojae (strain P6497) TaxID=1094619 RepID=G4ZHX2_PHYSP|nr:hypothetical protein PHYSODRAFT_559905 [Phytophthora sojae]EGZ17195.1 hypothetical protein PHYSODRAFT_559905 [Phytophthora sojae]|eukprot:XP_009526253.1 hypothetical protein PHYSODRAFT_559905 [Phytophthora sojae]